MNFKAMRWIVSAVGSALLLATAIAVAQQSEPVLTARPGVCILPGRESSECVMALELSWNSKTPGDYCLYSSRQSDALQCWNRAKHGELHSELYSKENVTFWLQRASAEKKLAKITIRIVSLAQKNPQRRRRRHVWSVL